MDASRRSIVDLNRLCEHSDSRVVEVTIPFDAYLEEGSEIDLDELCPAMADGYLVRVAIEGDAFAACDSQDAGERTRCRRVGRSPG